MDNSFLKGESLSTEEIFNKKEKNIARVRRFMLYGTRTLKNNVYERAVKYLFYESLLFHGHFPDRCFEQDHAGKLGWNPIP